MPAAQAAGIFSFAPAPKCASREELKKIYQASLRCGEPTICGKNIAFAEGYFKRSPS
jgi:hypothetical protein